MVEILLILAVTILVAEYVSERFSLNGPLVLMLSGAAISFIPVMGEARVEPEVILGVFLPLLLYWEALNISLCGIRRQLRGVLLNGTVAVIAVTATVGGAATWLGMTLAVGLLIGAAIGPTDATVVAAFAKGISPRGLIVLKAESLINDGTALVLFALALMYATNPDEVTAGTALWDFALSFGGGIAAGLVVGWLVSKVARFVDDPMQGNIFRIIVPLVTYVLAEEIHGSGIVAVVVAGLYIGQAGHRFITVGSRVLGRPFWAVLTHILNSLLFVLAGLAVPGIVRSLESDTLWHATAVALALYAVMMLTRFLFGEVIIRIIRVLDRRPAQKLRRTNLPERMVITVAGFRGAVSLAVALSVPESVPGRDVVVYVVALIVFASLLIQGLLLPWCIKWVQARPNALSDAEAARDVRMAQEAGLESNTALIEQLPHLAQKVGASKEVEEDVYRELHLHRKRMLVEQIEEGENLAEEERRVVEYHRAGMELRLAINAQARENLLRMHGEGKIDEEVLNILTDRLDIEQLRIEGPMRLE
ncbi:Na+/H+ antiporter [Corynebacterium lowii]|uniref:Na(+)/H(+) antiporter NhaG n=1 Tax=Corynebacterium lowii TaxID=1544413 RepID=A0A0Q1AJC2_9CORY|nr:Na+/H+ antiporter [Corynebacterium lowii]KQB86913.1 Na(+)/H(+) antiporter NhaG [Corynebacterium lowii]MDP9851601.1 CPA1 family monovalent cation:H+ antiporter [Corynebacterium lowii]